MNLVKEDDVLEMLIENPFNTERDMILDNNGQYNSEMKPKEPHYIPQEEIIFSQKEKDSMKSFKEIEKNIQMLLEIINL